MPFADDSGFVTYFLEHFRKGGLIAIEAAEVVVHEAVHVGVLAREDGGTGWAADGISAEGPLEQHAFLGDAIDVRGRGNFIETSAVSGNGFQGMVIGEDENDVRAFGCDQS